MKRRQCDRETTATAFNSSQTFRESEEEFENFGANSSENIIFNNLAKTPPKIDKNKIKIILLKLHQKKLQK